MINIYLVTSEEYISSLDGYPWSALGRGSSGLLGSGCVGVRDEKDS